MNESDFWKQLRFRLNCLDETLKVDLPRWQSDWFFEPKKYILKGASPCIKGHVRFTTARDIRKWMFTLYLVTEVDSFDEIIWYKLLPEENFTGWLFVNKGQRHIEIDPSNTKVATRS